MPLVIELPVRRDQTAFNLKRWEELQSDPYYAKIEGRVETNRHGEVIMSPPANRYHGNYQFRIATHLSLLLPDGEVVTECPISTDDGVRAADVVWLSDRLSKKTSAQSVLTIAPEICVEVLSPSNSKAEIEEKSALYFAAKAKEVWWCDLDGQMHFFVAPRREVQTSVLCPEFPKKITRR